MKTALIPSVPVPAERASQCAASPSGRNKYSGLAVPRRSSRRRRGTQGAQLLEFTLNFLPFMVMIIVLVDTAWAIFAQSTLQQAVRMAVRNGVTYTTAQVTTNLTDQVKSDVQAHAVGLLNGATGKGYIKVHYFDQDTQADVSGTASGNRGGNIMQVSVQGYPLVPLMPRFFSWKDTVDNSPMKMTVYAADMIEPIATFQTPAIGPAP
jgi:Flp pilus assembly protein TadG